MIPRVARSDFSQGSYLSKGTPAIITDGLSDWSDRGIWSPELLRSKISDRPVRVCVSPARRFDWRPTLDRSQAAAFSHEEMQFSEAMRRIVEGDDGGAVYLMQQPIRDKFPELAECMVVPPWLGNADVVRTNLWFGRDSITPLHYDGENNLFAHLYGTKEFTIFRPADTQYLYPFPIDSLHAHVSHVDPDAPDLQARPKFANAQPLRFTLRPGDLLFLPAFWWHTVRSLGVSISVNCWWPASMQHFMAAPNALRNLYQRYASDRLLSLQQQTLSRLGLNFHSTAEMLLGNGLTWGAGLLSLAAFDQKLEAMCSESGISRSPGCLPRNLPEELASIRTALPESSGVQKGIGIAIEIASRLDSVSDDAIDGRSVRALIKLCAGADRATA
ncbi:MAG TPA: cupin-like domain-containing protein [Steroidobacteraceae bacterium]|nr:cupin-like domain-containing protein [Steroidobacteraceae bacterium]